MPTTTARAVVVAGPQGRNLAPPPRELARIAWECTGEWGEFTGVAIGPRHFLTARHVGGLVGDTFVLNGRPFHTINYTVVPNADLAVWTVAEPFPQWIPLGDFGSEVSLPIVIIGRGTQRGATLRDGERVRGWEWGQSDGRMSWGTNRVEGIIRAQLPPTITKSAGGGANNEMLAFTFDENGDPNEASVSSGDSGGGVFARDEKGKWHVVGINYGVTGPASAFGFGATQAALFSQPDLAQSGYSSSTQPGAGLGTISLATRLKPHLPFLHKVLAAPPKRQILTRRQAVVLLAGATVASLTWLVLRLRRRIRIKK